LQDFCAVRGVYAKALASCIVRDSRESQEVLSTKQQVIAADRTAHPRSGKQSSISSCPSCQTQAL